MNDTRAFHTIDSPLNDPTSPVYIYNYVKDIKDKAGFFNSILPKLKFSQGFPKIKYISIYKAFQSDHTYKKMGRRINTRDYGIGILTQDNRYYYNTYRTRNDRLHQNVEKDLTYIMLLGFNLSPSTRILITDDIVKYNEPLAIFIRIIAAAYNIKIVKSSHFQQVKTVNASLRYFKVPKGKKFDLKYKNIIVKKMITYHRFEFLPDEFSLEKQRKELKPKEWKTKIATAIGIVYLNIIESHAIYKKRTPLYKAAKMS